MLQLVLHGEVSFVFSCWLNEQLRSPGTNVSCGVMCTIPTDDAAWRTQIFPLLPRRKKGRYFKINPGRG